MIANTNAGDGYVKLIKAKAEKWMNKFSCFFFDNDDRGKEFEVSSSEKLDGNENRGKLPKRTSFRACSLFKKYYNNNMTNFFVIM